ncbi:MAG: 50S ribosomal protein L5 [Thermoplasmata archaeon]|nr:50S ribosomal protein L5 [Thermoplasmata archaeon]
MQTIELEKVVVNIGVGEAGEKILRAERVLEMLTGQKPIRTVSKTTNKDLGIRDGQDIGCKVTLRGEKAEDFLKRAFWVRENKIWKYSFDPEGNFSFGIPDYTDFEGMRYTPDIGIFGMDISTTLRRKGGKRIATRKLLKRKIPMNHRITTKEGLEYAQYKFDLEVIK